MSRILIIAVLLSCALLTAGCNTVSGAASGAAKGAEKDYQQAKKADAWLQENLW
jgi:predicted small secreted protein